VTSSTRESAIEAILSDLEGLGRQFAAWHSSDFVGIDITMSQAKVLHCAAVRPGASISWLAQRLGVTAPTMSGLVERLVDHRLVERVEDPHDRRVVMVNLTAEGWAEIDRFRDVGLTRFRQLIERLDDSELEHLAVGVSALRAHVDDIASKPDDDQAPDTLAPRAPASTHERTSP
jgi:DNA-binding MarR family transcriptional regulator